jgi:hypothetical protein
MKLFNDIVKWIKRYTNTNANLNTNKQRGIEFIFKEILKS